MNQYAEPQSAMGQELLARAASAGPQPWGHSGPEARAGNSYPQDAPARETLEARVERLNKALAGMILDVRDQGLMYERLFQASPDYQPGAPIHAGRGLRYQLDVTEIQIETLARLLTMHRQFLGEVGSMVGQL